MTKLLGVLARVPVDDIDTALPLYTRLASSDEVRRFTFGKLSLAWVGPFLLLSGPDEDVQAAYRTATLLVEDLAASAADVIETGGHLLEGPNDAPNGPRMTARYADGSIFEYIQPIKS